MNLSDWASTAVVIGYIGFALITAAAFAGIALALSKLNARLEDLINKAGPLLEKTDQILTTTNEKISAIGDKTEGILAQGEETAENVHQKVDKTATAVHRTIQAPIIGLNSLAAGVSRGMETFGKLQRAPGNGAATALPAAQRNVTGGAAAYSADARNGVTNTENGQDAERVSTLAGRETIHGGQ